MFCPRCASQNADGTKFCRACGTDIEIISLALADQPTSASVSKDKDKKPIVVENWLGKRAKGVRNTFQGAILLGAALLIGIALALFSGKDDWIIIWTIFFGWMAGWGIVSLALGVGTVMELRTMLRGNDSIAGGSIATTAKQLTAAGDLGILADASTSPELLSSASVTEHTTEPLIKAPLKSKDA